MVHGMKFVVPEIAAAGTGTGDEEEVTRVTGEGDRLDNDEGDSVEVWFCCAAPFAGDAVPLLNEGIEENDI